MERVADLLYDLPKDYAIVFDVVHYIVCIQGERADLGSEFDRVSKQNPLVRVLSRYMSFLNIFYKKINILNLTLYSHRI